MTAAMAMAVMPPAATPAAGLLDDALRGSRRSQALHRATDGAGIGDAESQDRCCQSSYERQYQCASHFMLLGCCCRQHASAPPRCFFETSGAAPFADDGMPPVACSMIRCT